MRLQHALLGRAVYTAPKLRRIPTLGPKCFVNMIRELLACGPLLAPTHQGAALSSCLCALHEQSWLSERANDMGWAVARRAARHSAMLGCWAGSLTEIGCRRTVRPTHIMLWFVSTTSTAAFALHTEGQ